MKNSGGGIYGLGVIGALVYYLQEATSFFMVIVGILKAIFWPAVIVHKALQMLNL